ncbi:tyrosine--tRNA ligase [Candidatus Phytoplasma bonamiae]|uniref:Tyrosine--tRNA ligase n=1 Tax=Candidatus Phytoplasma bonamiae TaxID=2982626 RepID=A0ABT9D3T5_9MOLU|nr:tyrosine--tRNA ligase ['Bonamia sp.' little leaf phytoplasma]MDO8064101.1 tyrosine--tRNA ligase ['Bonamia sp.' little leaf phytoplasma]MDV3174447.1 tyrosine--tRNA ligase ['Bonamia sp.' little leaf phytoplasma]
MPLFEELKLRNLIKDCSNESDLMHKLNHNVINFYCGFDPTAISLTIGHLVQINTILLLYNKGHSPFILIGQATSLVGDPKETKERTLLIPQEVVKNTRDIVSQLKRLLPHNRVSFVNNYDWLSQINFLDFLRQYGKLFNIKYILSKKIISKRLNNENSGISYTEFSYNLLQAFDFYQLYSKNNVILQIGGSDQWGNITSGLELIRKLINPSRNKPLGMSIPLLLNDQGVKIGKSEKGNVWLNPELTSPFDMYQYFLNLPDNRVISCLKKMTLIALDRINYLESEMKFNSYKRLAQKELASYIVSLVHGQLISKDCEKASYLLFNKKRSDLVEADLKFLKKYLFCLSVDQKVTLLDVVVRSKLAFSKKEVKALLLSQSIKIFPCIKGFDYDLCLTPELALFNKYFLLTKKKKFNILIYFS